MVVEKIILDKSKIMETRYMERVGDRHHVTMSPSVFLGASLTYESYKYTDFKT